MNQFDGVYLSITSWAGTSIGAEHFYGSLHGYVDGYLSYCKTNYYKLTLTKPMSQEEADYLNKKDKAGFDLYQAGEDTERFNTKQEVIDRAIEVWHNHFPDAKILFCGHSSADPTRILIAPEPYFTEGNKLYQEAKSIGFWDKDEDAMIELSNKWDKLFEGEINDKLSNCPT